MPSKRDRKRQAARRADQRRAAAARRERRQRVEAAVAQMTEALEAVAGLPADPGVTPQEFAERLGALLDDEGHGEAAAKATVAWDFAARSALDTDPERISQLADAVLEARPGDKAAAWWAAGLCAGGGLAGRAEDIASAALGSSPALDPDGAWILGGLRISSGHLADAAELAFDLCEADPADEDAQSLLARSLRRIARRDSEDADSPCGCGSGTGRASCCAPAEALALARFADRSRLRRTWDALEAFVAADPELDAWRRGHVAELLGSETTLDETLASITGTDPGGPPLQRMALEQSSLSGPTEESEDSPLNRFADDPSTPAELATLARSWAKISWGYWQMPDPVASPGVWLTNLLTHETVYAAVPPEMLEGTGRWAALAAGLVADAGVWRPTDTWWILDPDQADRAAEITSAAVDAVVQELALEHHVKGASRLRRRRPRLDDPPPYGVTAAYIEPVEPYIAHLHHNVAAVSSLAVVATLWSEQSRPLRMTNTDKEPIELLRAVVAVDDPEGLRARLLARPDFEGEPEGTVIVWHGREMTALEAETSAAELRATLGVEGDELVEGPRRWMRGSLDLDGDELTIDVNSRERLAAITGILGRFGVAEPLVERRVDPALDLAVPPGWRPFLSAGAPAAEEAWRARWLDEAVPALGGISPRRAATSEKTAVALERLLRRFEHHADLAAAAGDRPLDVEALRLALGTEGVPFEF